MLPQVRRKRRFAALGLPQDLFGRETRHKALRILLTPGAIA